MKYRRCGILIFVIMLIAVLLLQDTMSTATRPLFTAVLLGSQKK